MKNQHPGKTFRARVGYRLQERDGNRNIENDAALLNVTAREIRESGTLDERTVAAIRSYVNRKSSLRKIAEKSNVGLKELKTERRRTGVQYAEKGDTERIDKSPARGKTGQIIIDIIAQWNTGTIPRGFYAGLAKKHGVTKQLVSEIARQVRRN
ncbi:MAG TPA: hypothetical protein VFF13_02715 [archaeon]|nr:hypothetical protein [archaeon]